MSDVATLRARLVPLPVRPQGAPAPLLSAGRLSADMSTELSFHDDGVDVVYQGTEFELEKRLIEAATEKSYRDVTDHEVLRIVAEGPELDGEPVRIGDVL